MGKRKNSTTTIIVMLFLLVFSLSALALTRENERRETLRINAINFLQKFQVSPLHTHKFHF